LEIIFLHITLGLNRIYKSFPLTKLMKIAMIAPEYGSEKAIAFYSKNLVDALKKSKISADLFTYTAGKPFSFLKILGNLKDYDIVHVQHEYNLLGNYGIPFFIVFPLIKVFKSRKAKIVTTMHTAISTKEKFLGSKIKNILRKTLYFFQNRWINFFSEKIILHQNFFVEALKGYGIQEKKINIFPQGILENIKLISKTKAKKELNLKGKVYLIIGSLHRDHGADIILNNAEKINGTILIAGNPNAVNDRNVTKMKNWLDYLKGIAKKNNSKQNIRFDLKKIPNELWWKYFSAANLILQPYRGSIGSGIFTDAMASQTPIIGSNVPFFRGILENYKCLMISKNDLEFPKNIKQAMISSNYKSMKEECKRYLKENGYTPLGKRYKEFYSSI